MARDFARWRTNLLCFGRFMFSSSFFPVRMCDVCADDLMISGWWSSTNHRGFAETFRELGVAKTTGTGISREQPAEVVHERMIATCDLKSRDDR
jgi:hypothetical protein